MEAKQIKSIRKKSIKQERSVAKDIGGKTTIASGALYTQKADCRSDNLLVECKTTEKTYYPLTIKTWEKIHYEALRDNMRIPVMNVQLMNGKYSIAVIEYLDLLGLNLAESDEIQYVGNPIPDMIEAKSYRITPDFLYQDFPQDYEGLIYHRHDFKFLDVNRGSRIATNRHLIMLDWNDFLSLIKRME